MYVHLGRAWGVVHVYVQICHNNVIVSCIHQLPVQKRPYTYIHIYAYLQHTYLTTYIDTYIHKYIHRYIHTSIKSIHPYILALALVAAGEVSGIFGATCGTSSSATRFSQETPGNRITPLISRGWIHVFMRACIHTYMQEQTDRHTLSGLVGGCVGVGVSGGMHVCMYACMHTCIYVCISM